MLRLLSDLEAWEAGSGSGRGSGSGSGGGGGGGGGSGSGGGAAAAARQREARNWQFMPADQQACAQRLRGASLQLVTVLLRALHAASLPVLPGGTDVTADAAAAAAAAAAVLPLPPLRLQPPLASLLGGVERGNLCRRATDAGAGAGAMELSVGAVFTWVLRLWEDELRRGLTVSELRVRQLADVDLSAQRGPGPGPAPPRRRPTHTGLLPTASWPFSAGYHPPSLAGYHTLFLPPLVIAPSFQPTGAPRLPRAPRAALRWLGAPPRRRRAPRAVRLRDRAAEKC